MTDECGLQHICVVGTVSHSCQQYLWYSSLVHGIVVRLGWTSGNTLESQLRRIKGSVKHGTQVLNAMVKDNVTRTTYNIPGVRVDDSFLHAPPPKEGDK